MRTDACPCCWVNTERRSGNSTQVVKLLDTAGRYRYDGAHDGCTHGASNEVIAFCVEKVPCAQPIRSRRSGSCCESERQHTRVRPHACTTYMYIHIQTIGVYYESEERECTIESRVCFSHRRTTATTTSQPWLFSAGVV